MHDTQLAKKKTKNTTYELHKLIISFNRNLLKSHIFTFSFSFTFFEKKKKGNFKWKPFLKVEISLSSNDTNKQLVAPNFIFYLIKKRIYK